MHFIAGQIMSLDYSSSTNNSINNHNSNNDDTSHSHISVDSNPQTTKRSKLAPTEEQSQVSVDYPEPGKKHKILSNLVLSTLSSGNAAVDYSHKISSYISVYFSLLNSGFLPMLNEAKFYENKQLYESRKNHNHSAFELQYFSCLAVGARMAGQLEASNKFSTIARCISTTLLSTSNPGFEVEDYEQAFRGLLLLTWNYITVADYGSAKAILQVLLRILELPVVGMFISPLLHAIARKLVSVLQLFEIIKDSGLKWVGSRLINSQQRHRARFPKDFKAWQMLTELSNIDRAGGRADQIPTDAALIEQLDCSNLRWELIGVAHCTIEYFCSLYMKTQSNISLYKLAYILVKAQYSTLLQGKPLLAILAYKGCVYYLLGETELAIKTAKDFITLAQTVDCTHQPLFAVAFFISCKLLAENGAYHYNDYLIRSLDLVAGIAKKFPFIEYLLQRLREEMKEIMEKQMHYSTLIVLYTTNTIEEQMNKPNMKQGKRIQTCHALQNSYIDILRQQRELLAAILATENSFSSNHSLISTVATAVDDLSEAFVSTLKLEDDPTKPFNPA
jgi:hypothetical protein